MAQLYLDDFDELGIEALSCELDTFIINVYDDESFSDVRKLVNFQGNCFKRRSI